jgi:hypothetical protein
LFEPIEKDLKLPFRDLFLKAMLKLGFSYRLFEPTSKHKFDLLINLSVSDGDIKFDSNVLSKVCPSNFLSSINLYFLENKFNKFNTSKLTLLLKTIISL